MYLSSSNDKFEFLFPKIMFPDNLINKYKQYTEKIPGAVITNPVDIFNFAVQSLTIPELTFDPIQQLDHPGQTRQYRANVQETELYDRTITFTCQTLTGFINYFMAIDLFKYYYDFRNDKSHLPCSFDINVSDAEGYIVSTLHFEDILFTSVSGLEFNFSSNTIDFKTFDISFAYNKFEIILNYK
ncbi:hypothetical protein [uncultured Methanobrevibacter sp.]|uniref:hypothetical protein n=1 Tax=uncultured Methanobrevibacter sp. TaxID=253161 RepID=UPI0025D32D5D|nr:hypothetical protein [uncultured Methanobrevibacter sp.]